MKTPFRLMMIGLVATSLLASCKKENNTSNTNSNLNLDGISFKASTEGGNRNAKTYLDGEDVKWMAYDLILVQNSANQQAPFEVVYGINTKIGTFYTGSTFDRSPDYVAAYPYDKATISGTTATFTLPQQQQMMQTGTFGNGAMPMVAHTTTDQLNFYNVCGGICFPLQGAGKHVTKIVLTSKNTSDRLWGTFTANCTAVPTAGDLASGPMPTHVSGGSNSVELICNGTTGITLTAEPQDFYIMVPPQTMTTGFTVTAYDGDNVIYNQNITWDATTHANFIKRSVVSKVETPITISDPLTVTTISPTFISTTSAYNQGTASGGTPTECGFIYALASDMSSATTYAAFIADATNNLQIGKTNVSSPIIATTGASFATEGMTGLTDDHIYVVRAYAKNAAHEVFYGDPIPFATRKDYANVYGGKLLGEFSVSSTNKVHFAMGNLQHNNSEWRYAEYQFEAVGNPGWGTVYRNGQKPNSTPAEKCNNYANQAAQQASDEWYDYFNWGTSGRNNGATNYMPYIRMKDSNGQNNDVTNNRHYFISGDKTKSLRDNANADWACNTIINGNASGKYTGSSSEWDYLINTRSASTVNSVANARFAFANLNVRNGISVNGLLLFPDEFTWPTLVNHYPTYINVKYDVGHYENAGNWELPNADHFTEAEWSLLEKENMVFLPAAGCYGISGGLEWANGGGRYWTSTPANNAPNSTYPGAHDFAFSPKHHHQEGIVNHAARDGRYHGFTVRFFIP